MSRFVVTLLSIPLAIALSLSMGCSTQEPTEVTFPTGEHYIQRGRALVKGLAACAHCHGENADPGSILSGGRTIVDRYGEVEVPNISPSSTGIGNWSARQIVRAIRASLSKDGEMISNEGHLGYLWMSDNDAYSIAAYLRTLPAVENEISRRSITTLDKYTTGLLDKRKEVTGYVPDVEPRFQVEYGKYLVDQVAQCGRCHNTPETFFNYENYLAGGRFVQGDHGKRLAPGITSSKIYGIGSWSEDEVVAFLKSGRTPDQRLIDSSYCPIEFYQNASNTDLRAVARYLRAVPAS